MPRPTLDDIREENDPGILERERLEREAPAMAKRIAELEAAMRKIDTGILRGFYFKQPVSMHSDAALVRDIIATALKN